MKFCTLHFTYILFSYIHDHNFIIILSRVFLTNQFNDLLPVGLLAYTDHHRYRRGQGFQSRTSLKFFQAFFAQLK